MWKDLSMTQRAEVIQMAIKHGIKDLNQIRSFYDSSLTSPRKYAMGGPEGDSEEETLMDKLA